MSAAASPSSQSELVNRRLAVGLSLSLAAHALLLSLQFGVPGLGAGAVSRLVVRLAAPLRPLASEPALRAGGPAEPVAAMPEAPVPAAPAHGLRLMERIPPPPPAKASPAKRVPRKRTGRPVVHPKTQALSERVIAQDAKPEPSFSIPQPEPDASTDSGTVVLRTGAEEGSGASVAGNDAEQRERIEQATAEQRLAETRRQAEEAAARQAQEETRQLEMAKLEQQRQEQERQAALRAQEQRQAEQALALRREQERTQREEQLRAAQEAQRQEQLRLAEEERTRAQQEQVRRQREQQAAEALARQQEREREAAAALAREQEQQRAAEVASRELARQRAAQEEARLLAEQRAAQDRQARQRQAEEQERQARQRQAEELAARQRAQEERLQAELRQREALAAQQKAQQEALRREAEDAARRQAEQLAQRQAEELARRRPQEEAQRSQAAVAGQESMVPGAGAGRPLGGNGLDGGATRPGRTALGSELGNRARELVRGLGVLGGAPPVARAAEDDQRQRRRVVSTGAERDVPLRLYIDGFRQKIERNGTLNGGQLGDRVRIDPVVSVALRSDGTVEDVMIVRSSGHAEVDAAVRRIVRLNERYAAFPPNVAALYDVIEVRRIWTFANGLKLLEEVR